MLYPLSYMPSPDLTSTAKGNEEITAASIIAVIQRRGMPNILIEARRSFSIPFVRVTYSNWVHSADRTLLRDQNIHFDQDHGFLIGLAH